MSELIPGLVSVVVPTFRSARHVEETLRSLLNQSGVHWECIVTDDASDDGTLDVVRTVVGDDERIVVSSQPRRLGAPGNWNAGAAVARGEYIKILCADDLLYDGALADQAGLLDRNPDAVMISGRRDVIDGHGRVLLRDRGLNGPELLSGAAALRRFVRSGSNIFGEPSFVLLRTEALRKVGGFSPDDRYLVDVATYARVLMLGRLATSGVTVGAFRVHSSSWSTVLRDHQGRETRACVRSLAARPDVSSPVTERWTGLARATTNAWARRLVSTVAGARDRYTDRSSRP